MAQKKIVYAIEYKVHNDDTILKKATEHGMKWQELAKFNWGTDHPEEINKYLKGRVGCRVKTKDGHNYCFSDNDHKYGTGTIYIPKDIPNDKKTYSSNTTHIIKVKQPLIKPYIISKCMVHVRPFDGWKGEFGFDWLRIGDRGPEKYESPLLDGGYKSGVDSGMTPAEAEIKIKAEYKSFTTIVKNKPTYYVPYLNLFPKDTKGNPTPPFEAKLKLLITVEDEAAIEIKFEIPEKQEIDLSTKPYFEVIPNNINLPTGIGIHQVEVTLRCLIEYTFDQEINVIADTREPDGKFMSYTAGQIIACANSESNRKSLKFVLVKVISDSSSTGATVTGSISANEKLYLHYALHQALIQGELTDGPDLDLSNVDDFKMRTSAGTVGKFYSTDPLKPGLNQDHPDFFSQVRTNFINEPGNDKFKDYFTVFAFGERPYDKAYGQVQDLNIHNLIIFPNRDDCTVNHEALHGLDLRHSFKEEPVKPNAKFTFQEGKTDNIMDYTYDSSALISLRWQWNIIN